MNSGSYESALFRLQHITEFISMYYSKVAEQLGLTVSQFELVFFVYNHPGCSISEISNKLLIDNSTISRMLDKLFVARLLAATQDEEDKRKKRLFVAIEDEKTQVVFQKIMDQWQEVDTKVNELYGELISQFENKISQD